MNVLNYLEEDTVYEVLVATENADDSLNIKPFGLRIIEGMVVLNLFANRTLSNIKSNGHFTLYFSQDILLFTEFFFDEGDVERIKSDVDYEVLCEVVSYENHEITDSYGKNTTIRIIAKPIKLIKHNEHMPLINRASNQIMDLLVDFSRYHFLGVHEKENFIQKINSTQKLIEKAGNKKHQKALNLIKKGIRKE